MITHIELSIVLRQTVCALYSNLVTRPTGAAVRGEIEQQLAAAPGGARSLTIIDFANVGLLDYSCADEVVAKLLLRFADKPANNAYFLFRGMDDAHLETIESVLERHGLALVIQLDDGAARLLGDVSPAEHAVWRAAYANGRAGAADVAATLGSGVDEAADVLDRLCARGLVTRTGNEYAAVGSRSWMGPQYRE